jgi:STE24 endopeptidase
MELSGLLVLPTLGRRQAFAADRYWVECGGDPNVLRATLHLLSERNLASSRLPVWVERIFHPVPTIESRLAAIDRVGVS